MSIFLPQIINKMKKENFTLSERIKQKLLEEYKKEQFSEDYYPYFEKKYRSYVIDDVDDCYNSETLKKTTLELSKEYIRSIISQLKIGHGMEWSERYASCLEEDEKIYNVYRELEETDEELAVKEIRIHSHSYGQDKHFEKFFVELLTEYDPFTDEEIERYAKRYSELYKQEIAAGKSECYAQKYAEIAAFEQYIDEYCRIFAEIYDFAKKQPSSDIFSFASDCAESYVNEHWLCDLEKLQREYPKKWQQEIIATLTDQFNKSDHVIKQQIHSKKSRSSNIEDTLEMMFPDGIDDGFTGVVNEDNF